MNMLNNILNNQHTNSAEKITIHFFPNNSISTELQQTISKIILDEFNSNVSLKDIEASLAINLLDCKHIIIEKSKNDLYVTL